MRTISPSLTPLALTAFSALILSLLCAHAYAREDWDATALDARDSWLDDGLFSRWHDDELAARDVEDDGDDYDHEYDRRGEEEDGWGTEERRDVDDHLDYRRDFIMNELAARQDGTWCVNGNQRIQYTGNRGGCDQSRSLGYKSSHNCKGAGGKAYYCVTTRQVPDPDAASTSQDKGKGKGKGKGKATPTAMKTIFEGQCFGKSKLAKLNMEGGECFK